MGEYLTQGYTHRLRSTDIQQKIQNLLNNDYTIDDNGVNNCLNDLQTIIIDAGSKSLKIKKIKRRYKINNSANKKWFDKECRIKRHTLRKAANRKHRDPSNIDIRNEYHDILKDYKNTLKLKKAEFHQQKLNEIEIATKKDPNEFWKLLKTCDDDINNETANNTISEEQWYSHFQNLHSKPNLDKDQQNLLDELNTEEQNLQSLNTKIA